MGLNDPLWQLLISTAAIILGNTLLKKFPLWKRKLSRLLDNILKSKFPYPKRMETPYFLF